MQHCLAVHFDWLKIRKAVAPVLLKNLHGLGFSVKCENSISLAIVVVFGTVFVIFILFFIIVKQRKAQEKVSVWL
jgi:hypothetical protein